MSSVVVREVCLAHRESFDFFDSKPGVLNLSDKPSVLRWIVAAIAGGGLGLLGGSLAAIAGLSAGVSTQNTFIGAAAAGFVALPVIILVAGTTATVWSAALAVTIEDEPEAPARRRRRRGEVPPRRAAPTVSSVQMQF